MGTAFFAGKQQLGEDWHPSWLFAPREIDAAFQRGFRSDVMVRVNQVRLASGVGEVRGDEAIQSFLGEWVAARPRPDELELDEVFDALQARFPGAQYLAANLVVSANRDDLLGKVSVWPAAGSADFDSINTAVFASGRRYGALAVMTRRIPEFSLRLANEGGGRFHNRCPHCGTVHALELDRESRTLILSCPDCDLPFEVLAVDSEGRVRRANEFLEGFSVMEGDDAAGGDEARILELWRRVAAHCRYEADVERPVPTGNEPMTELWKTSRQTWAEASGDCEDTSILLADVLAGAGFDARVAIGWNGNIGQHAWVVVKCGARQFLLETTLQKGISCEDLVEPSAVASFYQPEHLFDRERLYFTTARPEGFGVDYFDPEVWKPVPSRGDGASSSR